jgi:hypothetical protein
MANLGRHRTVGYRVVFTIFLPSGDRYTWTLYRRDKRQAEDLLGLATHMESLLRQHALTTDLTVTFQHESLLEQSWRCTFLMGKGTGFTRRKIRHGTWTMPTVVGIIPPTRGADVGFP